MTEYLLFTLYAPLAALGEIAVGERRMAWSRPARSAVFGLLAAALGLTRTQEEAHLALGSGYGFGVRTDAAGRPMRDYHTAQTPYGKKARNFLNRRAELSADRLETILSTREYRVDTCFTAAVWATSEAPRWSLQTLHQSLVEPHFVPFMGRKSCPFGAPFDPEIIASKTLLGAFAQYEPFARLHPPPVATLNERTVAFDHPAGAPLPEGAHIEVRRDTLISRSRWHYDDRQEQIVTYLHRQEVS